MGYEESYKKEHWVFNDEFIPAIEFLLDLLKKRTIPLKEIRFGFSYHYCKLNCKKGVKIFLRYNKKRMNNSKLVFQTKDFEMEAEPGSWDEIIIKQKEIEAETNNGTLYFVFERPIVRIFKQKLRELKNSEVGK